MTWEEAITNCCDTKPTYQEFGEYCIIKCSVCFRMLVWEGNLFSRWNSWRKQVKEGIWRYDNKNKSMCWYPGGVNIRL
jgi:hypothetical protein